MTKRAPLTKDGAEKLREELKRLKTKERPQVIEAIAEARAHGDLKENAEYHAAREQQGFIEGRIQEIESTLSHAEVIDPARLNAGNRIVFGAHVELEEEATGMRTRYQIVGDLEADIDANRISVSSPIARALIGKEAGDIIDFEAPGGTKTYEILQVEYA